MFQSILRQTRLIAPIFLLFLILPLFAAADTNIPITMDECGPGDWQTCPIAVAPGARYEFSDEYKSDATTEIWIIYRLNNGAYQTTRVEQFGYSTNWTGAKISFVARSDAKTMTFVHWQDNSGKAENGKWQNKDNRWSKAKNDKWQNKNGRAMLEVRNAKLTLLDEDSPTPPPAPVARPISEGGFVSFNMEDGDTKLINKTTPILEDAGFRATVGIITGYHGDRYLTDSEIKDLSARGYDIAAHTDRHKDLTTLSAGDLKNEVEKSRDYLAGLGVSAPTFIYPFGHTNSNVEQAVKDAGFIGGRRGLNKINDKSANRFALYSHSLGVETTFAEVKAQIDEAVATDGWYIVGLHHLDEDNKYSISTDLFKQIVNYLKDNNIPVATNAEGLREFIK